MAAHWEVHVLCIVPQQAHFICNWNGDGSRHYLTGSRNGTCATLRRYNDPAKGYVGPVTNCTEVEGLVPSTANGIHYEWTDYGRHYRCARPSPSVPQIINRILARPECCSRTRLCALCTYSLLCDSPEH
jgi:hypothetical protein